MRGRGSGELVVEFPRRAHGITAPIGSEQEALQQLVFWNLGSLARASWEKILVAALVLALVLPFSLAASLGERVLEGVRRGDMFILTHPEFKAGLVQRHRAIEDSFPEEPIDEERREAIPFLLSSPVYEPANRPSSPVFTPAG